MAVRVSPQRNDAAVTLLLNNMALDGSSDIDESDFGLLEDEDSGGGYAGVHHPPLPLWKRIALLLRSFVRRLVRLVRIGHDSCTSQSEKRGQGKRASLRVCMLLALGILMMIGSIELLILVGGFMGYALPNHVHNILESWDQVGRTGESLNSWPTDFTRDIRPIHCHSHNDYWRKVPLYSAISAGCISVEADVWLFDGQLYVGHSTGSLTRNRTLKALYIDPIMDILARQNPDTEFHSRANSSINGIFDTDAEQSLLLLIDFKTPGPATWPYVVEALEPLRASKYLSHWNGPNYVSRPVTVVGTGNVPLSHVVSNISNPSHDIFFDAPLDEMWESPDLEEAEALGDNRFKDKRVVKELGERRDASFPDNRYLRNRGRSVLRATKDELNAVKRAIGIDLPPEVASPNVYTTRNSYYASASFGEAIGRMWQFHLSKRQMNLLRGQIQGAHRRGLKVRYWDLPDWPISLRNHVWEVLMREGVDMLNVDDLQAAATRDWNNGRMSRAELEGSGK